MEQHGDSFNILRPPFRRQPSEAPSSPGADARAAASNSAASAADASWIARRRNQWRQQQQLSVSATQGPTLNPPPAARPRRSLQLPQPKSNPQAAPSLQPERERLDQRYSSETRQMAGQPRQEPRSVEPRLKYPPSRPAASPPSSSGSASGRRPARPRSRRGAGEKVTPLPMRPPADASGPGRQGRRPNPPRRPAKQAPLPVLYGIRLLILAIGVAAIAGTLLSVLSPTNLPASGQNAVDTAGVERSGSQAAGLAGGTVAAVPLGDELGRLKAEIEQLITLTPGLDQTVFLLNLDSGQYVDLNGDAAVSAASTIKVPILVAFLQAVDRGEVSLDQALALGPDQVAGGSGEMQFDPVGSRYTAQEVATQMIIDSDNTATNMIIDLLGGEEALNQQFQSWGLAETVLRNPLPDLDGTNTTSARDLSLLMALVDRGGLLTLRSRDRMLSIMQRTYSRNLIPAGVNETAIVANKTGDIKTILADVALIDAPNGTRYVLSALVQRPNNDGRAGELLRRTAETVDSEMNQPVAPVGQPAAESVAPTEAAPGSSSTQEIPVEDMPIEDMTIEELPVERSPQRAPSGGGAIPQG